MLPAKTGEIAACRPKNRFESEIIIMIKTFID